MMDADELRKRALAMRYGDRPVDDAMVADIEADVREYRAIYAKDPQQLPVAPLDGLLPLMGWLIYEASLKPLWTVPTRFRELAGTAGEAMRAQVEHLYRLADAARGLPWPEYAPRALGAIRVIALVESKSDTEIGYDAAWTLHEEAQRRYREYRDTIGPGAAREDFVRNLEEILLPLSLAETGTACRAAEHVLCLWAEEFTAGDPAWVDGESKRWTRRMFHELSQGAAVGELALRTVDGIESRYGLVQHVDEHRLSLVMSFRNPAIMTSRALLLLYSMCPEMEALGLRPDSAGTWGEFRDDLAKRFDKAFAYLFRAVVDGGGNAVPLETAHLRSMVQLCLHLALLTPGRGLPADFVVDDGLTLRRLDDDAVEAMSAWLAATDPATGRPRGDANTIGTASKPSFIASVEACRRDRGTAADYRAWRLRWPQLDRYDSPARRERIAAVLSRIPSDHPFSVG